MYKRQAIAEATQNTLIHKKTEEKESGSVNNVMNNESVESMIDEGEPEEAMIDDEENPLPMVDAAEDTKTHKGGDEPYIDPKTQSRTKKKFNKKFKHFKKKYAKELKGMDKIEKFNAFRNASTPFGKKIGDKRFFKKFVNVQEQSKATWWDVKTKNDPKVVEVASPDSGSGVMDQTVDVGCSKGKMTVDYNMLPEADHMIITNPATGAVIFDTVTKVVSKTGSGQVVSFDLGEGNTAIRVQINPEDAAAPKDTAFDYNLTIVSEDTEGQGVIIMHKADVTKEHKHYKKTTKK